MKSKFKKILETASLTLAALIVLYTVLALATCKIILDLSFLREELPEDFSLTTELSAEEIEGIERREVKFNSGENELHGYVWGKESGKLAVIAHGLYKTSNAYYPQMKYLVSQGYQVLTYDCTGTGKSEGDGTQGLSQSVEDLHNALIFTETEPALKDLPVYIFGHSWGGHAAATVLNYEHKNVKSVASVAGYNSNAGMLLDWMKTKYKMKAFAYPVFPFAAIWTIFSAGKGYYNTAVDGINNSGVPVFVVQGGQDKMVLNDSIYYHRDDITSDKAEYYYIENGGHFDILLADDAESKAYRTDKDKAYQVLDKLYGGEIPEDKNREFISTIDKDVYNGVNLTLMKKVCDFFAKA